MTAWRPLPSPSRRCEWKRPASQIVHDPEVATTAAPARSSARRAQQREIGVAVHDDILAEARAERFRDVAPDLVAADAGTRADGRGEPGPDAPGRGLQDAGDQPAPAGVHDRQRARRPPRRERP